MTERYSIGKVSSACNVPIKTLRYYDEIDLIKPEYRDNDSNYRYYSKEQMTTILCIRRLRHLGFCLKDIKDLVTHSDLPTIEEKVNHRCEDILCEIDSLNAKMNACRSLLARVSAGADIVDKISESKTSLTEIRTEKIGSGTMFFTRDIMKQYKCTDVSLDRWQDLYSKCDQYGVHSSSPVILTYHTKALNQFLMDDCDVEFGIIMDETRPAPNRDKLEKMTRPWGGFTAATAYHIGSYDDVVNSHIAILQWIHQNGYEVTGPTSEEYIVSPMDVTGSEARVTKIIMPIEKKS